MRAFSLIVSMLFLSASLSAARAADVERNWAPTGAASQSSTALGAVASRAIDGNTNGDWNAGSVTHTNTEFQPYWQIDLGTAHYIDEIRIYNRTDCCGDRLHDLVVFWRNSGTPFAHTDLSSTLGSDLNKPIFFQAGDINPATGVRLPVQTIKFAGSDCNNGGNGCLMRYVRIQLAGTGILSLAEVEIIEKAHIAGPTVAANRLSWAPTPVITGGSGVGLAADGDQVLTFYRGSDALLHDSVDFSPGPAIVGSPPIAPNPPAVAMDAASGKVLVAVRSVNGDLSVAEGARSPSLMSPATWQRLGRTSGSPAVIAACGRVLTAWIDQGAVRTSWKMAGSSSWSAPLIVGSGTGDPSLAVDNGSNIGLSYLQANGSIMFSTTPCAAPGSNWAAPTKLIGLAFGGRTSLGAYGPHFAIATMGGDGRAYFSMQTTSASGNQVWPSFEPIPASKRGDPGLPLTDPPRLFVMSGAMVVVGRARQTRESLYWIKYPNHIARGDTWMGGRIIGGVGTSAITPAMIAVGQSHLNGLWLAPSELYAVARGIGDQRLYALNLSRFIGNDVLSTDLGLEIDGMVNIAPQANRGLEPALVTNLFENLIAVLSLPAAGRDAVTTKKCGRFDVATLLELDREYASGQARPGACPFEVVENTNFSAADTLAHEWLHIDVPARNLTALSGFATVFKYNGSSMVPEDSGMRSSKSSADCGGDPSELAGDNHNGTAASTQDFDPAETVLRRWDSVQVCVASGGPDGRRYQGGLRWYDVGTNDHAFIHMALAYRWYGDDLRDWVQADLRHGNDQLQRRYNWVKQNYFGGVEYNGRLSDGGHLPNSDRSLGFFGMPSQ